MRKIGIIHCIAYFIIIINVNLRYIECQQCSGVERMWSFRKQQFSLKMPELLAKSTENVCLSSTCCKTDMRKEINVVSGLNIKSATENHMKIPIKVLMKSSNALLDYFEKNIEDSKLLLDSEFSTLYLNHYKTNKKIFFDFFDQLKLYMKGNVNNLNNVIQEFYIKLMNGIYQMIINTANNYQKRQCFTNIKLNTDVYMNLQNDLRLVLIKSYPISRIVVNYINAANDILYEIYQKWIVTDPSEECKKNYGEIFHCSLCAMSLNKPCKTSCQAALSGCLQGRMNDKETKRFAKAWSKLADSLKSLSLILNSQYSQTASNDNLSLTISSTIMNIQNKIIQTCGNSVRKKRSIGNSNSYRQSLAKRKKDVNLYLNQFITDINQLQGHFNQLDKNVCSGSITANTNTPCWNGTTTVSNSSHVSLYASKKKNRGKPSAEFKDIMKRMSSLLKRIKQLLKTSRNPKITLDPNIIPIQHKTAIESLFLAPTPPTNINTENKIESGSGDGFPSTKEFQNPNKAPVPNGLSPIKEKRPIFTTNSPPKQPIPNLLDGSSGAGNDNSDITQSPPPVPFLPPQKPIPAPQNPRFPKLDLDKSTKPSSRVIPADVSNKDDEDMNPNETFDDKKKFNSPINENIDGSGMSTALPNFNPTNRRVDAIPSRLPLIPTTTKSLIEPPRVPPINIPNQPRKNNNLDEIDESSGGTNKNNQLSSLPPNPIIPDGNIPSPQQPKQPESRKPQPTPPVVSYPTIDLNELPGEVPQEIWIPQFVQGSEEQNGVRVVENRNKLGNRIKLHVFLLLPVILITIFF